MSTGIVSMGPSQHQCWFLLAWLLWVILRLTHKGTGPDPDLTKCTKHQAETWSGLAQVAMVFVKAQV